MSIYEPNTHETGEGANRDWDHILGAISSTMRGLCVSGCGKPMAVNDKGIGVAEGLCLECGRETWLDELNEAATDGNVKQGLRVIGWMQELEEAA